MRCSRCKHAFEVPSRRGPPPRRRRPRRKRAIWQIQPGSAGGQPRLRVRRRRTRSGLDSDRRRRAGRRGPAPAESAAVPPEAPSGLDLAGGPMGADRRLGCGAGGGASKSPSPTRYSRDRPGGARRGAGGPDSARFSPALAVRGAAGGADRDGRAEPTSELDALARDCPRGGVRARSRAAGARCQGARRAREPDSGCGRGQRGSARSRHARPAEALRRSTPTS